MNIGKYVKFLIVSQFISLIFVSNLFSQIFAYPIGDKELANNSTHIVVGKVKNLECFWFQLGESKIICTKVFIEPENILKGKLNKKEMVIYTPYGSLDGIRMRTVGAPEYEIGEKVLVFCESEKEGYFKNYGLSLGKKTIKNELIIEDNISLQGYVNKIKSLMNGEIISSSLSYAQSQLHKVSRSLSYTLYDIKWKPSSMPVQYYINSASLPAGSYDAICSAFNTWQQSSNSFFRANCAGTTSRQVIKDGYNVISIGQTFSSNMVAQAILWEPNPYSPGDHYVERDIVISNNPGFNYSTTTPCQQGCFDIQNFITHEVGHFVGLGDDYSNPNTTMYYGTSVGEISKRILSQDDINGVMAGYRIIYVPHDELTISQALSYAVSGQTVLITGTQNISTPITIPSDITFEIQSGATVNFNENLTVNGTFQSNVATLNFNYLPNGNPSGLITNGMAYFQGTSFNTSVPGIEELNKAILLIINEKYGEALVELQRLIDEYKDGFVGKRALLYIELILRKTEREKEILPMLKSYSVGKSKVAQFAEYRKTYQHLRLQEYDKAIAIMKDTKFSEEDANLKQSRLYDLGVIYHDFIGDKAEAYNYFSELVNTYPDCPLAEVTNIFYKITKDGYVKPPTTKDETTEEDEIAVTDTKIFANYPNPFNPSTIIKYQLGEASQVSLKVYDMLGREVTTLVNSFQNKGSYDVTFNANGLSSGIYFYKLNANGKQLINKMLLMK